MAVYKIFPEKDATIYSEYPSMNTGIDEILEATTATGGALVGETPEASRFLVQFLDSEINDVLSNKVSGSFAAHLKLYMAKVEGLGQTTTLECYPVSGSWQNGTGKYLDNPIVSNGVSWTWQDSSGSMAWATGSFSTYATASFTGSDAGGGTWYTGSALGLNIIQTASYEYRSEFDIDLDVTNTVLTWYSGSLVNDGFIIKQSEADEFSTDTAKRVEFKYFSVDTNTIYPPCLEFRWDDSSYDTGSLTVLSDSQVAITLPNNVGTYHSESIQRFRINARPQYPTRTFTTSSLYTATYALPAATYYAVKDLDTNEFVINFDTNYTKVSCDSNGSYFDLYMNGLEPERYYKILIKTTIDGSTMVVDNNYYFKVING